MPAEGPSHTSSLKARLVILRSEPESQLILIHLAPECGAEVNALPICDGGRDKEYVRQLCSQISLRSAGRSSYPEPEPEGAQDLEGFFCQ